MEKRAFVGPAGPPPRGGARGSKHLHHFNSLAHFWAAVTGSGSEVWSRSSVGARETLSSGRPPKRLRPALFVGLTPFAYAAAGPRSPGARPARRWWWTVPPWLSRSTSKMALPLLLLPALVVLLLPLVRAARGRGALPPLQSPLQRAQTPAGGFGAPHNHETLGAVRIRPATQLPPTPLHLNP